MRKTASLFLLCAAGLAAADLHGYIVDSSCGASNARSTPEAKECARSCVKAGAEPVFVVDGSSKSYKIPDKAKVMAFVGDRVVINGELKGDTVSIAKIHEAAEKK